MTTVKQIYDFIDSFAPFDTQMDFDNCGLLVGDFNAAITKTLLTLDITKETIAEARQIGAELIISHHPVIFKPLESVRFGTTVDLLAEFKINVICAHTNLDMSPIGVNFCLAQKLELENLKPLHDSQNLPLGFTGNLKKEMDCLQFAKHVKQQLCCEGVRYTDIDKKIKKVAVASGSGGTMTNDALNTGADALVTGEIKHSDILKANQNKMAIVDAGHYRTENVVIPHLRNLLESEFNKTGFYITQTFTDKIRYI